MNNENPIEKKQKTKKLKIFDQKSNPANRIKGLKKEFEERAEELGITPEEFINYLIEDLKHYNEDGYKKIIDNIDINGDNNELSQSVISDIIKYLRRLLDNYKKEAKNQARSKKREKKQQELENVWKKFEEELNSIAQNGDTRIKLLKSKTLELKDDTSKESKYLLKKLEEQLRIEENKKRAEENREVERQWQFFMENLKPIGQDKRMEVLNIKVSELQESNDVISKKLLKKVQEQLLIEENAKKEQTERKNRIWNEILNTAMNTAQKEKIPFTKCLREMEKYFKSDKRLNINQEEKEEMLEKIDYTVYIEEVKNFTKDFSFLKEEPLIIAGTKGLRRTFTDKKSYDRYKELVKLFDGTMAEEKEIEKILKTNELDEADVKVLESRREAILQRSNYEQDR